MIRGIFGRTGGGKTLTVVKRIIETLLQTERMVVTNLEELNLGRLNEYLQECRAEEAKKHPARAKPPVDLNKRLLVIPKSETRYFYRYRAGGLILPLVEDKDKRGKFIGLDAFNAMMETYFDPCYSKKEYAIGVEYFMSEVHRFFPARLYQEFGHTMGFYATQHRHLDDNVWIESQFPSQIDCNFRELAVEWYHVRNHGREVMGMFRKRAVFSWQLYYELPSAKMPKPDDSGEYRLDAAGIASCYRTRGAISALAPQTPEEQPKSRKLPFWCLPAAVILVICLFGAFVMTLPKLTQKAMGAVVGSVSKSASAGAMDAIGKGGKPASVVPARAAPVTASVSDARVSGETVEPWPTGCVILGHRVDLVMSDGTIRTEMDSELVRIDRNSVLIHGKKVFIRPFRPTPRAEPVARAQPTLLPTVSVGPPAPAVQPSGLGLVPPIPPIVIPPTISN